MKIKHIFKKYWPLLLILFIGSFLRLYGLQQNPISLYSDEVDIGYQVTSLIKTGCDYSGHCLPLQFNSFSDVRTPLPIYFTAIVHLSGVPLDYSIRLVSVIFGLLGILATYLLIENLISRNIFNLNISHSGIFTAIILALIPWHFTYSRIGFELTTLYFFVTFGLYLYTEYLLKGNNKFIYLSALFLGLTPMVYSTAKMAVLAYPVILLVLSAKKINFYKNKQTILSLVIMFLPLVVLLLSGRADSRFSYISVFTDPTAPTEVNYQRLVDSGPNASVGTSPSLVTKLFHNKPLFYIKNLFDNSLNLLSTDYLFVNGDPNLRHSPENWGMFYRSLLPILLIGIYFLIRFRHDRFLLLLILLTFISISTSAITRDGGEHHASRSFMMILPLVIVSGIGLAYLKQVQKIIFYTVCFAIFLESIFFIHDYWFHYRYLSERSWSAGMKELVQVTKKFPNQPIVISPKYENPLIFYLYYTQFDPIKFQNLMKTNTLYNSTSGNNNLEGNKIGNTNLYIATLIDYKNISVDALPGAVYFLTKSEVDDNQISIEASTGDIIKLPSGEPLFYEVHY